MPGWSFYLIGIVLGISAAIGLLFAAMRWLRRRQKQRDDLVWRDAFAQRNPKLAAGQRRTTDKYDFDKAVAGRRRWLRRTARGRVLKSLQQLRREMKAPTGAGPHLEVVRRAGGGR
jgi:hypothetical protein